MFLHSVWSYHNTIVVVDSESTAFILQTNIVDVQCTKPFGILWLDMHLKPCSIYSTG